MAKPLIRKGLPPVRLGRDEFERRYRDPFQDPAFSSLGRELNAIIAAAWDAYSHSRKSPATRKSGPGFADPDYDIAVDWLNARDAIHQAQRRHDDSSVNLRILLINGSSRSEHTCPGGGTPWKRRSREGQKEHSATAQQHSKTASEHSDQAQTKS